MGSRLGLLATVVGLALGFAGAHCVERSIPARYTLVVDCSPPAPTAAAYKRWSLLVCGKRRAGGDCPARLERVDLGTGDPTFTMVYETTCTTDCGYFSYAVEKAEGTTPAERFDYLRETTRRHAASTAASLVCTFPSTGSADPCAK